MSWEEPASCVVHGVWSPVCLCVFVCVSQCVCVCPLRQLRKLGQKDRREVDLERKEQGFSLYLNGANTVPHRAQPRHASCSVEPAKTGCMRPSRTAGITHPHHPHSPLHFPTPFTIHLQCICILTSPSTVSSVSILLHRWPPH